ncbi:bleomycin resistance family protein [Ahniella affigens]|uniref:Bleomycin resistance family protein n=1 Tax=Ahniella affigens TaxID=2021234 RepID=A0A2P1PVT0_9GAMM|nr:VOC family protein [Ahniella affigens]AVP98956.1 bleomycin resistance family protein [Ahniella affigens]
MTVLKTRLTPALLVRDLSATLDFYQTLGFVVTGAYPDAAAPTWAEVTRDGLWLQFHTEPPRGTPPTPMFSGTLYFYSSDVAALADAWRGQVMFAWGPEQMPYGAFEFGLQDPNGYFLGFSDACD